MYRLRCRIANPISRNNGAINNETPITAQITANAPSPKATGHVGELASVVTGSASAVVYAVICPIALLRATHSCYESAFFIVIQASLRLSKFSLLVGDLRDRIIEHHVVLFGGICTQTLSFDLI